MAKEIKINEIQRGNFELGNQLINNLRLITYSLIFLLFSYYVFVDSIIQWHIGIHDMTDNQVSNAKKP